MKRIIYFIFICLITNAKLLNGQPDQMWVNTWDDDFNNQISINTSKWFHSGDWRNRSTRCVDFQNGTTGCTNYDLRAYRTQNDNLDFSSNSYMSLIVKQEQRTVAVDYDCTNPPLAEPCNGNPAYSTSNCQGPAGNSNHTFEYTAPAFIFSTLAFKYGYFEMRCRIPETDNFGIGANFWMWGHKCCAGSCQGCYNEIDIFEFRNSGRDINGNWYNANDVLTSNRHYKDGCDIFSINCPSGPGTFYSDHYADLIGDFPPVDFSGGQFHVFAAAWTPDKIEYYKDNEITYVSYNHPSNGIPIPIIIDINVYKDGECIQPTTVLPFNYDVDYVNVYELDNSQCGNDYVNNNCDLNNYIHSIYKNISLGNCNILQITGNDSYAFRASNSIEINDEFIFDSSGNLLLDNTTCHSQETIPNEN